MWQTALQHVTVLVAWQAHTYLYPITSSLRSLVHSIHSLISNSFDITSYSKVQPTSRKSSSYLLPIVQLHQRFSRESPHQVAIFACKGNKKAVAENICPTLLTSIITRSRYLLTSSSSPTLISQSRIDKFRQYGR